MARVPCAKFATKNQAAKVQETLQTRAFQESGGFDVFFPIVSILLVPIILENSGKKTSFRSFLKI